MMDLPAVFLPDPPRHCPRLIELYVGADAEQRLRVACTEIVDGDFVPVIAWRDTRLNPSLFRWPVHGHNVAIYGALPATKLQSLLAALRRSGALGAAGLDDRGDLQIACNRAQRAAA